MKWLTSIAVLFIGCSYTATAQLGLECAPAFQDGMVLQQGMPIPIWGKAVENCHITVQYYDQVLNTKTDEHGEWKVTLKSLKADTLDDLSKAPKGYALTIAATKEGTAQTMAITGPNPLGKKSNGLP